MKSILLPLWCWGSMQKWWQLILIIMFAGYFRLLIHVLVSNRIPFFTFFFGFKTILNIDWLNWCLFLIYTLHIQMLQKEVIWYFTCYCILTASILAISITLLYFGSTIFIVHHISVLAKTIDDCICLYWIIYGHQVICTKAETVYKHGKCYYGPKFQLVCFEHNQKKS